MADIVLTTVPCKIGPWTPNYDHSKPFCPHGIIIHATRGGTSSLQSDYQATVNYVDHVNPPQVGVQFVTGPAEVTRMGHDTWPCWHAKEHSYTHYGIETAQPTVTTPFVDFQYKANAEICARLCHDHNLPIRHVTDSGQPGIIGHSETAQGRRDGKQDPNKLGGTAAQQQWDWNRFIPMVQAVYDDLFVPKTDPAYDLCGSGLKDFLLANPRYGKPRFKSFYDEYHNEYVWCTPSDASRFGVLVVWRKYLSEIGKNAYAVAVWD